MGLYLIICSRKVKSNWICTKKVNTIGCKIKYKNRRNRFVTERLLGTVKKFEVLDVIQLYTYVTVKRVSLQ